VLRVLCVLHAAVQLVTLHILLLPLVALQAQQLAIHFDVRLPSILPINRHLLVVAFFPFALEDRWAHRATIALPLKQFVHVLLP